jgi:hypothetical protein
MHHPGHVGIKEHDLGAGLELRDGLVKNLVGTHQTVTLAGNSGGARRNLADAEGGAGSTLGDGLSGERPRRRSRQDKMLLREPIPR